MSFTRLALFAAILIAVTPTASAAPPSAAPVPVPAGAVLIRSPGFADAAQVAGAATIRIFARSGERVRQASLDSSSGNPVFDEAALRAVRRWRYVPAWTGDSAQPEWLLVRLVYVPDAAARVVRSAAR